MTASLRLERAGVERPILLFLWPIPAGVIASVVDDASR
jgi:hypothetical protein